MISEKNHLAQINKNEIFNMSRFIVSENFKHHSPNDIPGNIQNEINSVYNEEMKFIENTKIFAVKNNLGNILGTIRVLKWDFINPLPIEKLFGINPLLCIQDKTVNGVKTSIVGESIDYLGSETIPVMMSYAGLIDFYNRNKNLISIDMSKQKIKAKALHNRVVFDA